MYSNVKEYVYVSARSWTRVRSRDILGDATQWMAFEAENSNTRGYFDEIHIFYSDSPLFSPVSPHQKTSMVHRDSVCLRDALRVGQASPCVI